MTANAYRCADCGHHETVHKGGPCRWGILGDSPCPCTAFMPGDCDRCRGFGCNDCADEARQG
jgi:hypothetical protein